MEKRTDLALEIRESFPEDHLEVEGVAFREKEYFEGRIRITTVEIRNARGQQQMNKPMGNYITIEFTEKNKRDDSEKQEMIRDKAAEKLAKILKKMLPREEGVCLVAGLGNRFATPDALGPFVLDDVKVNRHVKNYLGEEYVKNKKILCAISPGVMGQTGMESQEILGGIIEKIHPCCLLVVDSLASRSVNRLCTTIQITDTGICPGAGIGNNRNELSREKMKIPVVAIGVPTVVCAGTIVSECMEETFLREGYTLEQIDLFLRGLSRHSIDSLFVTPKDIDEQIRMIGKVVAKGINLFASEKIENAYIHSLRHMDK
jgi:spore protease